jgi:hypothetical protein
VDAPQCDSGVCTAGICEACTPGVLGCPCAAGACTGAICDATSGTCRIAIECTETTCSEGRRCSSSPMMDATCLDECLPGFRWDAPTMSCIRVMACCDPDSPGCSIAMECAARFETCVDEAGGAICRDCLAGYLREGESCRPVRTCDVACTPAGRDCVAGDEHTDAVCTTCLPGYREVMGVCRADPTIPCADIRAMCTDRGQECVEDSDGARCEGCLPDHFPDPSGACIRDGGCAALACRTSAHRECQAGPPAACTGACVDGYALDPSTGDCVPRVTCTTPGFSCPPGTACFDSNPMSHATCATIVCEDAGQVFDMYSGTCVPCPRSCTGGRMSPDETGSPWPRTVRVGPGVPGRCICETAPNFYYDTASLRTVACDEDEDGWVRLSARAAVVSTDPEVLANARCVVRTAHSFVLQNEAAQEHTEMLSIPVELWESSRNDSQFELDTATTAVPPYGPRALQAEELNSLTKACVAPGADHNHNFVGDVSESDRSTFPVGPGGMAIPADLEAHYTEYTRFGYFVELHTGAFEADDPAAEGMRPATGPLHPLLGSYRIVERSRPTPAAAGGVPIQYTSGAGPWSEQCLRHRDADYAPASTIGMDLARFESAGFGGMLHHSQYRCLQVVDPTMVIDPATNRHLVTVAELTGPVSEWDVNRCATAGSPIPPMMARNPFEAPLSCTADGVVPAEGQVLWGAATFRPYADPAVPWRMERPYERGCIDECVEQSIIPLARRCPGLTTSPGMACEGDVDNFGHILCGCLRNYGGAACEVACPGNPAGPGYGELFLDPAYEISPRSGYWMCGHLSATHGPDLSGGGFELRGEIPITAVDGAELTGGGYSVRSR